MNHWTLLFLRLVRISPLLLLGPCLRGAVYTYDLENIPGIQNDAVLVGNISVNTDGGFEDPGGSGNFFLGHSAVFAWNFEVTPSGGGSAYTGSSLDPNASATGLGGAFALYATPTTLSVLESASLELQSGVALVSQLFWNNGADTGLYAASFVSATWNELDKTTLDSSFSSYPVPGGVENWVVATAIPEPGSLYLGGILLAITALSSFKSRPRRLS